jgi:hypothetical protein
MAKLCRIVSMNRIPIFLSKYGRMLSRCEKSRVPVMGTIRFQGELQIGTVGPFSN